MQLAALAMEKVKVWPIEKYARFVSGGAASSASAAVDAASSSTAKKTEGAWQVRHNIFVAEL